MASLHHHIEHEKDEDMPRLEKLLEWEESEALAGAFQRIKMISVNEESSERAEDVCF
jgi:hypothetical protein